MSAFNGKRKLGTRQKLHIAAMLLLAAALLFSCGKGAVDPLAYRDCPFTAELKGRMALREGEVIEFSATASVGEPSDKTREISISFHSPSALDGLCFCRHSDGGFTVRLDDSEYRLEGDGGITGIAKIMGMLEADGDTVGISSIPGKEAGLTQYERLTLIDMGSYLLLIDPHTSAPVGARSADLAIDISFEAFTSGS